MSVHFFKRIEESRLVAIQKSLNNNASLSLDFIALLAASTTIATVGLFQNSAAVIIGAMIIAPLMRPLVSMSLATITADTRLILKSVLTLLAGTMLAITISFTMAQLLRTLELTPEILGRTHPNLLDLSVALTAGAIGAYCQAKEELANSLAGVAIAVALVPPLSVVGIGLAIGDLSVASGALLLYITNLVGITIAGALVFLLLGFSPFHQAKRALAVSASCLLVLIIPLALSMRELLLENQISSKIRMLLKEKTVTFRQAQLRDVKVLRFNAPMNVVATVIGSESSITPNQVKLVQDLLRREIGTALNFKLRIIPSKEITAFEVSSQTQQILITPEVIPGEPVQQVSAPIESPPDSPEPQSQPGG